MARGADVLRRDDEPLRGRCASELASRVPFSSLRARARGALVGRHREGAVPHRRRPPPGDRADALPRRPPVAVPLEPVGLPADLHVLRHRVDGVRAQPHGVGDPRPGAALPPQGGPVDHARVHGDGRAAAEPRRACWRPASGCPSIGIHPSSTTISTVGWIPGIDRLAEHDGPTIRLALSLHAPDDALRSELMPVNERYPLADVLDACRRWHELRRRKVFVEYLMLAGVNDRYEQALQLAALLEPAQRVQGEPDPLQPDRLGLRGVKQGGDRRLPARCSSRPASPPPSA